MTATLAIRGRERQTSQLIETSAKDLARRGVGVGPAVLQWATALLDNTGVATIGGPDFGILGEGYIRLSYANSTENILKALDRMGQFLASRKAA